jgi:hypothetical protein
VATVARNALAAYDDPNIPKAMLHPWPSRNEEQQAATVATLTSRPSYAKALLVAIRNKNVPASAISPFQARQIRSLGDESAKFAIHRRPRKPSSPNGRPC